MIEAINNLVDKIEYVYGKIREVWEVVGGFFGFLGFEAVLLLLAAFFLLYLLNAVSPFNRWVNFFLAYGASVVLFVVSGFGTESFLKFSMVMLFPLAATLFLYLLYRGSRALVRRFRKPEPYDPEKVRAVLARALADHHAGGDRKRLENDLEKVLKTLRHGADQQKGVD